MHVKWCRLISRCRCKYCLNGKCKECRRHTKQNFSFLYISNIFAGNNVSRFSRLNNWRNVGEGDIKIFLAHLIVMGLVRKGAIEKYWDHGETVKTPFFGTYVGRNAFQAMSNFQVSDSTMDLPRNNPNHDKLFKVRPFVDMMVRTFLHSYKPGRDISVDEGCCPFKGQASFKCYNPSKPAKWHLKLYEVSDARTGYVVAFEIYNGKGCSRMARDAIVLDPQCNVTLDFCTREIYWGKAIMSTWRTIILVQNFFYKLHHKDTFACGTCRPNRKGMPKSVTKAKLRKRKESVFF